MKMQILSLFTFYLLLILVETPHVQTHSRYTLMLSQSKNLSLSLPARLSIQLLSV